MSETTGKEPTINFAIGPSCPVRCEGCYNHFGDTFSKNNLITTGGVLDFAAKTRELGVTQATLSGGDPLFHPDILDIARGIDELGYRTKLDTVGTSFLEDSRVVYKGRGIAQKIGIDDIKQHIDFVSIPLDGASQETVTTFRKGRSDLFQETLSVAKLLRNSGVKFGINTVASAANLDELPQMQEIAEQSGANEWQIFEYDPSGPNLSAQKSLLRLEPGEFLGATESLESRAPQLKIDAKSLEDRSNAYFLIDDSGLAWKPSGEGIRTVYGHIIREQEVVLTALSNHLGTLRGR